MSESYPNIAEKVSVEWIIVADHVEVVNGKLYVMGGGWDVLWVSSIPNEYRLGLAIALAVPWNETNSLHPFNVKVLDQDGSQLAEIGGQVEMGRPPGIRQGHTQRAQIGVNMPVRFEQLGTYEIVVTVQEQSARVVFNVQPGPNFRNQDR